MKFLLELVLGLLLVFPRELELALVSANSQLPLLLLEVLELGCFVVCLQPGRLPG